jgi:homotetrameric cytidine deaminase
MNGRSLAKSAVSGHAGAGARRDGARLCTLFRLLRRRRRAWRKRCAVSRMQRRKAAFPLGSCAEASAISAMVMAGERRILEVLVIGKGPALVSPCGGCRQRLYEFADDTTPVHICDSDGLRRTVTLGELLPLSFGPGNLAA